MSKRNFKLTIEYLGTSYSGWQYQLDCSTIQAEIEDTFKKILHKNKQNINLVGSGRTDSGVHAFGQVANIVINTNISAGDLKNAINANISNNIFIKDCFEVDLDFNSRFSAKKRCYIYKISRKYSPFINDREWFNNSKINTNSINQSADLILGNHNFSLLSKTNSEINNKNCEIYLSHWDFSNDKLIYTIEGNRFLHHMVRYLVGTMIEIGKENISIDQFKKLLNNESNCCSIFKAPPQGLYLNKIYYE